MKEFMLLIRKDESHEAALSPEQQEAFLKKVVVYIEKLMKEGKLKGAQPLEEGSIISGSKNVFKDGPFNEAKEVIAGYYHILAKDMEEAKIIAKENPEFEFYNNTRIEIRSIKTMEVSNGYLYPTTNAL